MNHMKIITSIIGSFLIFSCTTKNCDIENISFNNILNKESISKITAIEFFSYLQCENSGRIIFSDPVANWVKKEELTFLSEYLEDNTPCPSVSLTQSSYIPPDSSNLKTEACFIILGYKYGKYPPALNSTRHNLESTEEIIEWLKSIKVM